MRIRTNIVLAVCLVMMFFITFNCGGHDNNTVTDVNYDKIKHGITDGMTLDEVKGIMGEPSETKDSKTGRIYIWKEKNGNRMIWVTIKDGMVRSKGKSGFK